MAQFCVLGLLLACANVSYGFSMSSRSAAAASPLTDEAVAIYGELFPFGQEEMKQNPLLKIGMPNSGNKTPVGNSGRRLTDIDEKRARAAFSELAKLYGPEDALEMVKIFPTGLAFNYKTFGESLNGFTTIFGEEKAKAMVVRNPCLLAIKPSDAEKQGATSGSATFASNAFHRGGDWTFYFNSPLHVGNT
eukprot:scaffold81523_cov64-Attheya_sp.AAC.8